jgi:ketosteroid isomerase-like protein
VTSADERAVLDANAAFYAAFAAGDAEAMDALWTRSTEPTCVHPGWDALRGRERVMASWRAIFRNGGPPIACAGPTVHALGTDAALVLCSELIAGGTLVAVNVFVREQDRFRLVHHQASPAPPRPTPTRRADFN